ncbi:MAG: hypothetical protein NVS4B3_23680 [Gemmatimonadaceae bacterium]
MRAAFSCSGVAAAIIAIGCGRSNNLLLGRVDALVGSRTVVVTDCYRVRVPPPVVDTVNGIRGYRFAPCRDAVVVLQGDSVAVNGIPIGVVGERDTVIVDHGVVRIGRDMTTNKWKH